MFPWVHWQLCSLPVIQGWKRCLINLNSNWFGDSNTESQPFVIVRVTLQAISRQNNENTELGLNIYTFYLLFLDTYKVSRISSVTFKIKSALTHMLQSNTKSALTLTLSCHLPSIESRKNIKWACVNMMSICFFFMCCDQLQSMTLFFSLFSFCMCIAFSTLFF